jgi:hypothetical protein
MDRFSASEQGLGYIYQPRFALLKMLEMPESTCVLIEKEDDLDFVDASGIKTLASLKHKAVGDRITDLSVDFWKSVNIWIHRYNAQNRSQSSLRFFLFSTATVSSDSLLRHFLPDASITDSEQRLWVLAVDALGASQSKLLIPIREALSKFSDLEKEDFFARITIFDESPRIVEIPAIIKSKMRAVRREIRDAVYERLEGWWNDLIVRLLSGQQDDPIHNHEISDKLSSICEEYTPENLPITFRNVSPAIEIDVESDSRVFVQQLRALGIGSTRIRNAILDYYRAFEQRSAWARENLLVSQEIELYEDRLVDEWERYREVVFEDLNENSAEPLLTAAGKELYKWAEMSSGNMASLQIRARVTEPYVLRGGFHILANNRPTPRVYWHPSFLAGLQRVVGAKP